MYSTAKTSSVSAVSKATVTAAASISVDYTGVTIASATLVAVADQSTFFAGVVSGNTVTYPNVPAGDYNTNLETGTGFATFTAPASRTLTVTLPAITAPA